MTKQPKLSKAEAIKEIEKLTELKLIHFNTEYGPHHYVFTAKEINLEHQGCYCRATTLDLYEFGVDYNANYCGSHSCPFPLPLNWLEPLSRLIPILFKEGE